MNTISLDTPPMSYRPDKQRYERPDAWFRRCGRSGLMLPAFSLGGWHNFTDLDLTRNLMTAAFDRGVTHFDMANNYGPPPGRAERVVGKLLKNDFKRYRDELIISSKAGYRMWNGPYGEWGSRKYLIASCEASLRRLKLDYVDIFYSHRPDPHTPIEETMGALDHLVRQGKALYAGVSSYNPEQTLAAHDALAQRGTPLTIHQPSYNILRRDIEHGLLDTADRLGVGVIVFCPLAQGLLTDKYLGGIPEDSRAASKAGFLSKEAVTPQLVDKLTRLKLIANERGQTLAQLALSWILREPRITSILMGASKVSQIEQNLAVIDHEPISDHHLWQIGEIAGA